MVNITKLLCGFNSYGDILRYKKSDTNPRKPVVVWNSTRKCNLSCIHCYSNSSRFNYTGEISHKESIEMLQDLASFKIPVVLFSGGEPLIRQDIFELMTFSKKSGIRTVLSTNGTLIDKDTAKKIKNAGVDYVGISIDGIGSNNDEFRGKQGAFDLALSGIRNLKELNQNVGLRLTLTKHNFQNLEQIFHLVETEGINRICFYHLVYSGRAAEIKNFDLSHKETRDCLDKICQWVISLHKRGIYKEVLTVDNHADNVFIYLKVKETNPKKQGDILNLVRLNGGDSSGIGIVNIDNKGFVYPDQFWHTIILGNIRTKKFSEIWNDNSGKFIAQIKERKSYLKGRCAKCRYIDICNGNSRARAEFVYGDMWQEDPACYLTDDEIAS
jgi:radical SAM protein with 4Fe4S-binding SPASM domain